MYDDAVFGSHSEREFLETKVNYHVISEVEDELGGNNAYISVLLQMDDEHKELIRRIFTLSDAFSKVGGFMTIIFMITEIVVSRV